jgi:hypothetical protein
MTLLVARSISSSPPVPPHLQARNLFLFYQVQLGSPYVLARLIEIRVTCKIFTKRTHHLLLLGQGYRSPHEAVIDEYGAMVE